VKQRLVSWGERYLYAPGPFERVLSWLLWPLSQLYCAVMAFRYKAALPRDIGVPVVSVGNLTVGGSGKTPLVTALAARCERTAIVLRGYGRQSRGLVVVSDGKHILCDVKQSGDEAMIYALQLPEAVVIVSEVREAGIEKAKEMGCETVFLDDAYGKHRIAKLDLVIDVETPNRFCLPAGPYRERLWKGKEAVLIREGEHFTRKVGLKDASKKMVLVTAIARPQRLDPFLPEVVGKHYFPDHHFFTKSELERILKESGADSLLVTLKDYVKIQTFKLPLSLLDLELELSGELTKKVDDYILSRKIKR
jgi:tetraacyldisaccharide 4'-kinase